MDLESSVAMHTKYKLRDFIQFMASGITPKITEYDKYYSDKENGVPFLRVQNLSPEGLDYSDCKYINKQTHEKMLKRSQVFQGDLLIKITGVGRMAITTIAPEGFEGNINQHIVVVKTKRSELNEQIAAFLNSDIGEMLATHRATGGTRPALDYASLRSIPIILNAKVPEIMERAYKEKKIKEKEVQSLVNSINDYLLQELGIKILLEKEKTLTDRMFYVNSDKIVGDRFDSQYYSHHYRILENAIECSVYKKMELSQITKRIFSGTTPSRDDYSEEKTKYPVIKVGSYLNDYIDLDSLTYAKKMPLKKVQQNDIFILSASHQNDYVGKFIKFLKDVPDENTSFVGEFICVRANNLINPFLLFHILKLDIYKELLNREKRGQSAHIYSKDISKILIPVPDLEKQLEMVHKIENIQDKVNELEHEAFDAVNFAKEEVAKILLEDSI